MNWQDLVSSACNTHHVTSNGAPAYEARFDQVLSFHSPGLAAVQKGPLAWHINTSGSAIYPQQYSRTFGFYNGLATVVAHDGWHHIDTSGNNLQKDRYSWCGNFQQYRCTVRDKEDQYFHLNSSGNPLYPERWRYAGDYREGTAVVQAPNGLSTHIDLQGIKTHNKWFIDVDVYHKQYARACDSGGWHHIDTNGNPIYTKRYSSIEPFYNGQARVEGLDGSREVIDESGKTLTTLRQSTADTQNTPFSELSADLVGFWRTKTIATFVELGIPDTLPATLNIIATSCELSPEKTLRLLNALAELDIVASVEDQWLLTPKGAFLNSSHPLAMSNAAAEYAGHLSLLWDQLPQAFRENSGWKQPTIFTDIGEDEKWCANHHQMLQSYALHDYPGVLDALPIKAGDSIIDAGGGVGTLASLLSDAYPNITVTVLELPAVIDIAMRGSEPQKSSVVWHEGNLFETWKLKADTVIFSRVLHDWNDEQAIQILHRARNALDAGGTVIIIELLLDENTYNGALCDLHLLAVTGGQERTASHYSKLLKQTGFTTKAVIDTASLPSVVIAEAI